MFVFYNSNRVIYFTNIKNEKRERRILKNTHTHTIIAYEDGNC
jgi:hypothetical protein